MGLTAKAESHLLYSVVCPLHLHSRSFYCTPPFICSLKSESGLISQTRMAIPLISCVYLPHLSLRQLSVRTLWLAEVCYLFRFH